MSIYLYQHPNWPHLTWDTGSLAQSLGEVRYLQGKLMGSMEALGFELKSEALLQTLTLDVLKSTEIEGEFMQPEQVRSSLARKLGMDLFATVPSDRHVDGMVEMMLDATQRCFEPLTAERLFGWHAALFPTGRSGMYRIVTGNWRDDANGPMQVVSGAMGEPYIHFQAPPAADISGEMAHFLHWFNQENQLDPVLKAALAHLWFLTVHPFEDGNGRIARALTDLLLARADRSRQRFYSMSSQIQAERKGYYDRLEMTQKGGPDVTGWMSWFLNCLKRALLASDDKLETVLKKARFWQVHLHTALNERQRLMINKLLDGFEGKLTSSKWAKIAKCSSDTALRDIQDLLQKGVLDQSDSGGRSVSYDLLH